MDHILTLIVFFPIVAGIFAFLVHPKSVRVYGISVATIEFILSIILWLGFDTNVSGTLVCRVYSSYIPSLVCSYYLGS